MGGFSGTFLSRLLSMLLGMAEIPLVTHIDELIVEGARIRRAGVPRVSPTPAASWDYGYGEEREPEPHRYVEFDAVALKQWRNDIKMVAAAAMPPGHHVIADALKLDDLYHDERLLDDGAALLQSLKRTIERGLLAPTPTSGIATHGGIGMQEEELMRRILVDVYNREGDAPLMSYTIPGIDRGALMRAIRRLVGLGWLEAVDCSTRGGMDFAPRNVTAAGLDWLQGPQAQLTGSQVVNHYHAPVVQGHHASIATANNSPGATVTAASGGATIEQRIRVHIEEVGTCDRGVSAAIQQVADAIAASGTLASGQRAEAQELLLAIAEECAKPPAERQPAARSKGLAAGMREALSLAADVLQVWTTCWPSIAPALGIIG